MTIKTEIEKKYLINFDVINHLPLNPDKTELIDQAYLLADDEVEVRVRQRDDKWFLGIKVGQGISRLEIEPEIDEAQFKKLSMSHPAVTKQRYTYGRWEIDRFLHQHTGLILAEIELESEDEEVEIPEWLKPYVQREVTDEKEYKNKNLALDGLP